VVRLAVETVRQFRCPPGIGRGRAHRGGSAWVALGSKWVGTQGNNALPGPSAARCANLPVPTAGWAAQQLPALGGEVRGFGFEVVADCGPVGVVEIDA